jgi:hypothetical protein
MWSLNCVHAAGKPRDCTEEEQFRQWIVIVGVCFLFIMILLVCCLIKSCWSEAETLEATLTSHPPPPSYDELDIEPLPTYDEVMLDMEPPMTTTTESASTEIATAESSTTATTGSDPELSNGASTPPPAYTIHIHREQPPSYADIFSHSEQHMMSTYI